MALEKLQGMISVHISLKILERQIKQLVLFYIYLKNQINLPFQIL